MGVYKKNLVLEKIKSLSEKMGEEITLKEQKQILKDFNLLFKSARKEDQDKFVENVIWYAESKKKLYYLVDKSIAEYVGISAYYSVKAKERGLKVKFDKGGIIIDGRYFLIDSFGEGMPYFGHTYIDSLERFDEKIVTIEEFGEDKALPSIDE